MKRIFVTTLAVSLLGGCAFDEGIFVGNMQGKVVVPRAAATRTLLNDAGEPVEVVDSRLIGPVYLGLYPSVKTGLLEFPHPEIGPIFRPGIPGDTYPFGGTTIGDFRMACVEFLTCRVSSGRFIDFDDLLSWFNTELGLDIPDRNGESIQNGDYMRQTCYDMLNYTTDDEIRVTALDTNDDGLIDDKDLDFQERDDGNFEAEFTIWQQEYFDGFALWGWMDSPSEEGFRFSTCNENFGYQQNEYADDFFAGAQHQDLLNQPSNYMGGGDYTVSATDETGAPGWHIYQTENDYVELWLDNRLEN